MLGEGVFINEKHLYREQTGAKFRDVILIRVRCSMDTHVGSLPSSGGYRATSCWSYIGDRS